MSTACTDAEQGLLVVPRRGQRAMVVSLVLLIAPAVDFAGHATGPRLLAGAVLLSSAMQKLGAHSRAEAIRVAEDEGWL